MPPPGDPSDPQEWLRRARSDLALARSGRTSPEVLFEDLCFHAQQAAEKAMKGVLVWRAVPFPKTHAIADLITIIESHGVGMPDPIREAAILTRHAVANRYPGLADSATEDDHRRATELADRVVRWAHGLILPARRQ